MNNGEAGVQSRCSRFVSRVRCEGIAIGIMLLPRSRFARVAAPTTTDTTPTRPTRAMVVCSLFRGEGRRVPNGSPSAQRTSASARRPPGRTFGGSPFAPATRRRLRMTYWRRQKFPRESRVCAPLNGGVLAARRCSSSACLVDEERRDADRRPSARVCGRRRSTPTTSDRAIVTCL